MMSKEIHIVIADDHALIRKGLVQILETEPNFKITEVINGKEALAQIRDKNPDIALLDIEMPVMSGFDVAKQIKTESLAVDIIFLTMFKDEVVFNKAMDIGVKGYVLKENTVSEIIQCIESIVEGNYYLSPAISEFLIRRNTKLVTPATDRDGINVLTNSEKKIMKQLSLMKTSQEIADEFNISIKTVQNHRNNICQKLELSGAHALLKFSIEHSSRF